MGANGVSCMSEWWASSDAQVSGEDALHPSTRAHEAAAIGEYELGRTELSNRNTRRIVWKHTAPGRRLSKAGFEPPSAMTWGRHK